MSDPEEIEIEYFVMCIGNIQGGDDAIGPYIANKLKLEKYSGVVLDCGTVPENFTSFVKKYNPNNLIIIDAVEMNLKVGEIRIVPKEKIGMMHISTHDIPISILINYLEQYVKNIIFIGIQPMTMTGRMSKNVKESADILVKIIRTKNFKQIKSL